MHLDAPLRRLTIWMALVGYALVASGLPLPCGVAPPAASDSGAAKRLGGKDRSRPFPCMDKPCGCDTADRCFTSCCCHTPAETLAWARGHGVAVDVLAALERRVASTFVPPRPSASAPRESCCETACCAAGETIPAAGPAVPRTARVLTLRAMLACGGIAAEWFAAGAAPPPPRVELVIDSVVIGRTIPADAVGAGSRDVPEPPPPRAA